MTQPVYGSPNPAGERWNVNMPAVIGIVFVFLVAVIVWVVVSSSSGDDSAATPTTTQSSPTTVAGGGPAVDTSVPPTTTPAPMPDASAITTAPTSTPTTTLTSTTAPPPPPATTAPGADPDTVPGDLAVAGHAMQRPGCDDSFITVIASAIGEQATAVGIANVLDAYPGSSYLRTDQTCPSLTQSIDGAPIYVVYFGPFAFASDACAARAEGTEGAYARRLSNDVGPNHGVSCA